MGGKIFPTNTRIESKEAFSTLYQKQLELLSHITDKVYIPREIDSKTSFGDLDLVIPEQFMESIAKFLEASELPHNITRNANTNVIENNVLSYQYDLHQVDLIFLPEETIEYSVNYFSFGDHGNILGRLLKTVGIKNSFKGLFFDLNNNGNKKNTILLASDYYEMLDYLKLDKEHFKQGFTDQKDLFDWITSSPYFQNNIYSFELMTNKNRVRDMKRPFYHEFLVYLETNSFDNPEPLIPVNEFFPSYDIQKALIKKEFAIHSLYKSKFNGTNVSNLTGLSGLDLGFLMKNFKNKYTYDEIVSMDQKLIDKNILDLYNSLNF